MNKMSFDELTKMLVEGLEGHEEVIEEVRKAQAAQAAMDEDEDEDEDEDDEDWEWAVIQGMMQEDW